MLLLIVLALSAGCYAQESTDPCGNVNCPDEHYCRLVVKTCPEPPCRSSTMCVPCIPANADDECNHQGYLYSVISYDTSANRFHEALSCNNGDCPAKSTCIRRDDHLTTQGVCCYGGPYKSRVYNRDTHCLFCPPGGCGPKRHCFREESVCTPVRMRCRLNRPDVKSGFCPGRETPDCGPDDLGVHKCDGDLDCPSYLKCCPTCNGTACQNPMIA